MIRLFRNKTYMGFQEVRQEIDTIDTQIINLLSRRFSLLDAVVDFKLKNNLPILDQKRETEILLKRIEQGKSLGIQNYFLKNIFSSIMNESRNIQHTLVAKKKKFDFKKIKIISIIGGTGKMGQLFQKAFENAGFEVLIAGRNTKMKIEEAASLGDLVIVCVPISMTEETIRNIAPYLKKSAILSDFTSIKGFVSKAMAKSFKGTVIGAHPLFGPAVNMNGQNIVICPIRSDKKDLNEFMKVFEILGLYIKIMKPEEHDKLMAIVQCVNHFDNIAFADFLFKNKSIGLLKDSFVTPAFLLKANFINRTLAQDASLYSEIETYNTYAKKFVGEFFKSISHLKNIIDVKDSVALEKVIKKLQIK